MAVAMAVKKPKKLHYSILSNIEMDEEFVEVVEKFKDRKLTADELELKIHADRVMYVLNRCIAKINVIAHLPHLLEDNAKLLKKYTYATDQYFILQTLNDEGAKFSLKQYNSDVVDGYHIMKDELIPNAGRVIKEGGKTRKARKSSECGILTEADLRTSAIAKMVDLLFYNKCCMSLAKTAKDAKVDKFLIKLMHHMNSFKLIAKERLYVTGDEEEAKDKELRNAYKSNLMLTATIEDLQERIEKQRVELGSEVSKTVEVFEKYNQKMKRIKEEFQQQMEHYMVENERAMMKKVLTSEEKQVKLAEDAKKLTHQFETLLENNLKEEKTARIRRYKTETQLYSWICKFDQEVGDRQAELDVLQEEFDQKQAEVDEIEELLDEQEEEYDKLMAEKTEEEDRIFNEMAYTYLVNRSARKIQRAWRGYKIRKASKKKGKKGKGGKEKKKKEAKPEKPSITRQSDPMAALQGDKKIKDHVFEDFEKPDVKFEPSKMHTEI